MNTASLFMAATKAALLHGMVAAASPHTAPVQIRIDGSEYKTIAHCYVRTSAEIRKCGNETLRIIFHLSSKNHVNVCMAERLIAFRLPTYSEALFEMDRLDVLADRMLNGHAI